MSSRVPCALVKTQWELGARPQTSIQRQGRWMAASANAEKARSPTVLQRTEAGKPVVCVQRTRFEDVVCVVFHATFQA